MGSIFIGIFISCQKNNDSYVVDSPNKDLVLRMIEGGGNKPDATWNELKGDCEGAPTNCMPEVVVIANADGTTTVETIAHTDKADIADLFNNSTGKTHDDLKSIFGSLLFAEIANGTYTLEVLSIPDYPNKSYVIVDEPLGFSIDNPTLVIPVNIGE